MDSQSTVSGVDQPFNGKETIGLGWIPYHPVTEETPQKSGDVIGFTNAWFDWVDPTSINVDDVYQRQLSLSRVRAIADDLDPDVIGIVTLSKRDDGTLWALDGQHRIAGVVASGATGKIPAHILGGLTPEDEARIYYKTNRHRLNTSAIDAFRARLAFREPVAVGVQTILDDFGLRIASGMSQGGKRNMLFDEIMAVAEAEQIYRNGLLSDVLSLIHHSWEGIENAHKANYLRGIAMFFSVFYSQFFGEETPSEVKRIRMARLQASMVNSPPNVLDARARFFSETLNIPSGPAYARAIHDSYQNRVKGRVRLPNWGTGNKPEIDE